MFCRLSFDGGSTMAEAGKGVIKDAIERKLTQGLSPSALMVIDESHLHAGHGHSHAEGESHFRLEVVSAAFGGKSRVERHRMVNALLADELAGRVHALAIAARTPEEGA
jgi:BolA protein